MHYSIHSNCNTKYDPALVNTPKKRADAARFAASRCFLSSGSLLPLPDPSAPLVGVELEECRKNGIGKKIFSRERTPNEHNLIACNTTIVIEKANTSMISHNERCQIAGEGWKLNYWREPCIWLKGQSLLKRGTHLKGIPLDQYKLWYNIITL